MDSSKVSRITRTAIVTAVAVLTIAGTAQAAGDGHRSRYVKRIGNGPERIAVRCAGWAEDSASRLILVNLDGDGIQGPEGDRYVYRCLTGGEVR